MARRIEAMLDAPTRARLVAHHVSPLGRSALAAEASRDPAADPAAFERFAAGLADSPAGVARLELHRSLMGATGTHDFVADLSGGMQRAFMQGALAADPVAVGASFESDLADLEWQRGIVRFMLARELPAMLAFTYDELPRDDLHALLAIAREGDQARLLEAVGEGLADAVRVGSEDFASRLREAPRDATDAEAG